MFRGAAAVTITPGKPASMKIFVKYQKSVSFFSRTGLLNFEWIIKISVSENRLGIMAYFY